MTMVRGNPIFSVSVRVGSTLIETGVDTGSTGLRVLPNVLKEQDAQAGERPEFYSYGSGIKIEGVVGTARIAFGNRAGEGLFQMIRTVGCLQRQPNCPFTHVGGVEHYRLMGEGVPMRASRPLPGSASQRRGPAQRHTRCKKLASAAF
jgi:hypothetical protein